MSNLLKMNDPTDTVLVTTHPDIGPQPMSRDDFFKREMVKRGIDSPITSGSLAYINDYDARVKALELANEHARFLMINLKINQIDAHYPEGSDGLLEDVKSIHKIADMNLKFLIGNK